MAEVNLAPIQLRGNASRYLAPPPEAISKISKAVRIPTPTPVSRLKLPPVTKQAEENHSPSFFGSETGSPSLKLPPLTENAFLKIVPSEDSPVGSPNEMGNGAFLGAGENLSPYPNLGVHDLIKKAKIARTKNNHEEAIRWFNVAYDKASNDSTRAEISKLRGLSYYKNGQMDEAERDFRRVISISTEDLTSMVSLIQILQEKKDYDGLIEIATNALNVFPSNGVALKFRALAYIKKNEIDLAYEDLLLAKATRGRDEQVLYHLGRISFERGNLRWAKHYLEKLHQINPENHEANVILAKTYLAEGKYLIESNLLKAFENLQLALLRDPSLIEPLWRGKFLFWAKEYRKAIEMFKLYPVWKRSSSVLLYMGKCYQKLNQTADAMICAERCLKINPDDIEALKLKAYIYYRENQKLEARTVLDLILQINPEDSLAKKMLTYISS